MEFLGIDLNVLWFAIMATAITLRYLVEALIRDLIYSTPFVLVSLYAGVFIGSLMLCWPFLCKKSRPFLKAAIPLLGIVIILAVDIGGVLVYNDSLVELIISAIPEPAVGAMCGCAFLAYIFLTSLRGHSGEKKNLGMVLVNGMVIAITTGAATIVFALAGAFLLAGQYALVALGLVPVAIPIVLFELRRLTLPPHRRPAFIAA